MDKEIQSLGLNLLSTSAAFNSHPTLWKCLTLSPVQFCGL